MLSTPNLAGDLWALYRFEVSMVDSPERYLLARQLVERLGWERGSLVRKDMWEDNRWKDWGPEAVSYTHLVYYEKDYEGRDIVEGADAVYRRYRKGGGPADIREFAKWLKTDEGRAAARDLLPGPNVEDWIERWKRY